MHSRSRLGLVSAAAAAALIVAAVSATPAFASGSSGPGHGTSSWSSASAHRSAPPSGAAAAKGETLVSKSAGITVYRESDGALRTVIAPSRHAGSTAGVHPALAGGNTPDGGSAIACTITSADPATPCTSSSGPVTVGWDGTNATRAAVEYDLSAVPSDLGGQAFFAAIDFSGGSGTDLSAYRATTEWDPASVSWNRASTATAWTKPGGDIDTTTAAYNGPGMRSSDGTFDITQLMRDWISGAVPNDGVILKETVENTAATITDTPYLEIMSWPRGGNVATDHVQNHAITPTLSDGVDPINGNIAVEGTVFPTIAQGLSIGFSVQSDQLDARPQFSVDYRGTTLYRDPFTTASSKTSSFVYGAPDGASYAFVQTATGWATPPGLNATASATTVPGTGASAVSIHFPGTGITNLYTVAGGVYGELLSSTDSTGMTVSYKYTGQVLTSIVTTGHTYTIAHNAAGSVSSITDSATKKVASFTYTVPAGDVPTPQLATYTGTSGQKTTFGYDEEGRLDKITAPTGDITTMQQQWADNNEMEGQVTSVTYHATGAASTYGYSYEPGLTTIANPDGSTTTVAYNPVDAITSIDGPL